MRPSHPSCRFARVSRSTFPAAIALGLALVASSAWATGSEAAAREIEPPATSSWDVLNAVATISLDRSTLAGLGLEVVALQPSVSRHLAHPLSVAPPSAPSFASDGATTLRAAVATDGFHGFEGGSFRARGGFRLRGAETFDLSGFELRPAAKSTALELVDAHGVALLVAAEAQWEFDAERGVLRYLNADLRILPELAHRLGDDRYVNVTVGLLALDLTLRVDSMPAMPPLPVVAAPPPCGDWTGVVDVALTNMSNIGQAGISVVNGRSVVVVLPSADLKNVGTANVPWYSKFTNLGVPPWNDQHPFLVWQMTRSKDGVLEPLGRSDLKHAFLTLNTGCDAGACTDSHVLGLGCSDVYSTGTNNSVGSLAPRAEVTASTGIWAHCGGIPSHFDTNGDCSQDFSGAGENAFTHGLKAAEADLQGPAAVGASYYVEAFYIIRNDTNIFNSMGYRQVAPAKPGSTWTFPTVGAYAQGPPINAWVNPTTPGPNADNRLLDTTEGRVQLAMRATDVSGSPGRKRFAYALQNHDFDRRLKSFRIPFDTTAGTVSDVFYVDGDGFAINDWTAVTDATGITWTAPAATTPPAELDYASLVSFRFDFDGTAVAKTASLGVFEAGSPTELQLQTLAPAGGATTSPGSFFAVTPCRLIDTRGADGPNGGPALTSGVARAFPVRGQCGIPATAMAVALNVTAIEPASSGHVDIFFGAPPSTSTLNYNAGQTRANNAISGLDTDGSLKVMAVQPVGTLQVVVDVSGYFE